MFSKTKKTDRIDAEQREQYEYARRRIKQKKSLMRHFIMFLVGSTLFIILNVLLKVGEDILIKDWYIWAILIWTFIFLIHVLNVFVMNKFMDKEWEDRELEKLKVKQVARIAELQKKVDNELQLPRASDFTKRNQNENLLPPDVQ